LWVGLASARTLALATNSLIVEQRNGQGGL